MPRLPSLSLETLKDLAGIFADAYPATTGVLATPSLDPNVERVREALLLLSGSVFDRATELGAAGYDMLGALLCPNVLRPTPSATILEITPQERAVIARGAEAVSSRGQRFACTRDCPVSAVRIEGARSQSTGRRELVEFDIVSTSGAPLADVLHDSLDFFVDKQLDAAAHFCDALGRATVTFSAERAPQRRLPLRVTRP